MTFAQATGSQGDPGRGRFSIQLPSQAATAPPASSSTSANTGTTLVQYAVMMAQAEQFVTIDPSWVLLDSQSTISVFRNKNMLNNIRQSPHVLRAITNGGYQDSNMVGDFPNLGTVWYNADSIANILSLAEVRKVCKVTMDTAAAPAIMHVHRKNGSIMSFVEHPSGLYVYNGNNSNDEVTAYTLLSTVAELKKMFPKRQVDDADADAARALYRKIGRPDEAEFQTILRGNFIQSCPVTPDDAKRALVIYGPDIAVLKCKMTRSNAAPRAPTYEAVPIPAPIMRFHRNVTLCVDFFFVQGLCFLHTISRGIGYRTVVSTADCNYKTILKGVLAAIKPYKDRNLVVRDVHADTEFGCIRPAILPTEMNVVPPDSHVGEVEHSVRTIKDRLRTGVHGLPFKRLPKIIVRHMVTNATRCLNQFPRKKGISSTMSPATIVTGVGTPDYHRMKLEFGAYVQVFEDSEPTNTRRARSNGCHCFVPNRELSR